MVSDSDAPAGELVLPPLAGLLLGGAAAGLLLQMAGSWSPTTFVGGASFGCLYALCQQRTSWLGYALVGLSYACTIWIVTHLLSPLAEMASAPTPHVGFGPCLLWTELLALAALLTSWLSPRGQSQVVPKD
jgi:hypothetical protein